MARKRATLSDLLNDLTFRILYDKFRLLCINEYKWTGLPEWILERHIEKELFEHGKACFFEDPDQSYMCLPVSEAGKYNYHGDPLNYRVTGYAGGYARELRADDCVIIENNKLRLATKDFIMFYVNKLAEAERTMDVNVKANKTPIVMLCDNNDVLSFKRIFHMVDGNVPAIFADKKMNMEAIQALDMKAKFLGNELMDYKRSVENELLTFLGYNNNAVDKKERTITDEVNANNQLIEGFLDLGLEARERACEDIKKMYGLDVTVERRQPVEKAVESVEGGEGHGGTV